MSALGERLVLDLPDGAQYGRRSTALMEALPGDDETLIWVGEGDDRIAVYIEELNVLADEDFEKQAREILANDRTWSAAFEIKTLSPNIVCALRTSALEQPTGADLYGVAFVRHADGSLIRMKVLFAANHADTPEKNREFAEKVISSVRSGSGVRCTSARNDKVSLFGEPSFDVPVPEGFVRTVNPGPDFTYTVFAKLKRMSDPTDCIGIYLGGHPSFHGESFEGAQKVAGSVAGKTVTWYCYEPEPGVYRAECCVCVDGDESQFGRKGGLMRLLGDIMMVMGEDIDPEPPLYMHLIIVAPSAEARETQIKQLARIRKSEKPA